MRKKLTINNAISLSTLLSKYALFSYLAIFALIPSQADTDCVLLLVHHLKHFTRLFVLGLHPFLLSSPPLLTYSHSHNYFFVLIS